ncbi:hypothetical protein MsAg5_15700 [Methanosarcinaceae archaeon Ag5]|uniref:Bacterial repeat domain-containing protein n=1 Tax=Methanolapillus africanus TaxID=3028297 RepID=A0AAE4MK54_9EURY|nr:hypothetical protein [Methanosarcinaceae archaeon Ag5]
MSEKSQINNKKNSGIVLVLLALLILALSVSVFYIYFSSQNQDDLCTNCSVANPSESAAGFELPPANEPPQTPSPIIANNSTGGGGSGGTPTPSVLQATVTVKYLNGVDDHYGTIDGSGTFNIGDEVTVTATPVSPGYKFMKWVDDDNFGDDAISTSEFYTFTLTGDTTLYAVMCGNSAELNLNVTNLTDSTIEVHGHVAPPSTPFSVYLPQYLDERILTSLCNGTGVMADRLFSSDLTAVEIPNSVAYIGPYAFYLRDLTSITLPSNLTKIEGTSFSGCDITSLTIPRGVESIESGEYGAGAFSDCQQLTTLTFESDSHLTTIGSSAFIRTAIDEVVIPEKVTIIGDLAFANCQNLERVEFLGPQPTTWDPDSVFSNSPSVVVYYHPEYADSWASYTGSKQPI